MKDDLITIFNEEDLKKEMVCLIEKIHEAITGNKEWFTEKEAREYLGVSKSTLHNWRKDGIIPYSQFKGKIYYRFSDICTFLDENNTHSKRRGGHHVR